MYRRDPIDSFLTFCGMIALGALLLVGLSRVESFRYHAADFRHRWFGHLEGVGGPLDVDGPLMVHGNLYVGGPATVYRQVHARAVTVGGPIEASLPRGEAPGRSGQAFRTTLAVGGPLTVKGRLIVDGRLIVGGPLTSEPEQ